MTFPLHKSWGANLRLQCTLQELRRQLYPPLSQPPYYTTRGYTTHVQCVQRKKPPQLLRPLARTMNPAYHPNISSNATTQYCKYAWLVREKRNLIAYHMHKDWFISMIKEGNKKKERRRESQDRGYMKKHGKKGNKKRWQMMRKRHTIVWCGIVVRLREERRRDEKESRVVRKRLAVKKCLIVKRD